jgi:CubicO group peptidase (beta-lactamase class C family)
MLRQAALLVIFTQLALAEEWETAPAPPGIDELLKVADAPQPLLGETRAVVVIHHGKLVAERYMNGFSAATPLLSWSMAKSVTQAMLGIAVRRGLVDIDKPMGNPRWAPGDRRSRIPWRWWINMVDGQDYHEVGDSYRRKSDAAKMLFGAGRTDVAGFAARLPLIHDPGSHWNYNSAGINLVADGLGRVFAPNANGVDRREKMLATMKEELFDPIGMTSARPEFDTTGTFVGSAFVYATARDWARFGYLYLKDGVWNGKRILPEGWVDFARAKNPAPNCDVYGAGFWISPQSGSGKPRLAMVPNAPKDTYWAEGHEGQLVVIVPSKDLVIVRLGLFRDDAKGWPVLGQWIEKVVALF